MELAGNQNWDGKGEVGQDRIGKQPAASSQAGYRRARPGRVLFGLTGAGT